MRIAIALLVVTTLATTVPPTAQVSNAELHAKIIAPYIDNNTVAVGRFDLTRPNNDEPAAALSVVTAILGMKPTLYPRDTKRLFTALGESGVKDAYGVISFAEPANSLCFVVPSPGQTNAKAIAEMFGLASVFPDTYAAQVGSDLVIGTEAACKRYAKLKPVARPEVAKAFAAVNEMTGQICLMLSPDARRAFEEIVPTLPPEVGGGSITLLTRGVQWIAIGFDGPPKRSLHAVLQVTDEAAAARLKAWLETAITKLAQNPETKNALQDFDKLAAALMPAAVGDKAVGDKVVVKLNHEQMTALIKPLIDRTQLATDRTLELANLSKIGLAMHFYHDNNKAFPTPANYDKQGKPLLSWRVHVLPYLGLEKLYKEFKLDEAWDSPHNKELVAKIPPIYRHPLGVGVSEGKTPLLVPVGESTMFPGGKGVTFRDVTDGTSNTILALAAADDRMVIWTKPEDWQFDPKNPHRGLVDKNRPRIPVLFADASVRTLANDISAETLRAVMTRNAGDTVGADINSKR
jgi:hypothetical protein